MLYFTHEIQKSKLIQRTAGIKARDDITEILKSIGAVELDICLKNTVTDDRTYIKKLAGQFQAGREWKRKLDNLKQGDTILIQCPAINHSIFLGRILKRIRKKGVYVILLLHDLEILRSAGHKDSSVSRKLRIRMEESSVLKECDYVIAHNSKMKQILINLGMEKKRIIELGIFDYLISDKYDDKYFIDTALEEPVIIAGNFRRHKANYVYNLPEDSSFNLYGVDYTGETSERIRYHGSFPADELIAVMKGSFGLVWDGDTPETCSGVYGEYLKVNNPHKTSLYLACGIPVIIWSEAALASFIREQECGITVDRLGQIADAVNRLTPEEYDHLRKNAQMAGQKLRHGFYTKRAVAEIEKTLGSGRMVENA